VTSLLALNSDVASYVCDVGRINGSDRDTLFSIPDELVGDVPESVLVKVLRGLSQELKCGISLPGTTFVVPEKFVPWARVRLSPPPGERGYLISAIHRAACSTLGCRNFSLGVWQGKEKLVTCDVEHWLSDLAKTQNATVGNVPFSSACSSRQQLAATYRQLFNACNVSRVSVEKAMRFHNMLVLRHSAAKNDRDAGVQAIKELYAWWRQDEN